ncbi:Beta-Ala-Xaa dipeptidase [Pseudoalteromonas holothuriae]|uniref:Beta-Ala-Xaa dipeptidase n=1 Tax=Pseudoalteromonas holothuriae TaxID=2963714 RepID=A0ABM9GJR5_9GAMM|nr:dipeptidase [Pseudoalteromonas sp. CIP111951]CAH9061194.1 Beta-Ala-Xaa dipeptidase [Pseudoalteromonas sp. CIP111951]
MTRFVSLAALVLASSVQAHISDISNKTAEYAVQHYQQAQIHTLANMVSFPTVNKKGLETPNNPDFIGFKQLLKIKAAELGLDYQDFGHTVLIGLGQQRQKVTVVTHGDVQPADPSKWQQSPFLLDSTSQPGKLIARGTEDDKGPIATALYAMKAIKDQGIKLDNRIELMIYLAEESDWAPLKAFMKTYEQPKYAITIDASYPVVVAEKGWSLVEPVFKGISSQQGVYVSDLQGGAFKSQIPEDASLVLHNASAELIAQIKTKAQAFKEVKTQFIKQPSGLKIAVAGVSAHSSEPEAGVNAIAYLASLFNRVDLEPNADGQAVMFIRELIGTGLYGKQFGKIAYSHDFMGPMTVSPTLLTRQGDAITLSVNLRRPVGKNATELESQIRQAVATWQQTHEVALDALEVMLGEPMLLDSAPHAQKLLDIFKHYTQDNDAGFVSIGGGTNAKLFDNAVSFGPSMPGKRYTGHSEHEFITVEQLKLNLRMYTAMMIELGNM